MNEWLLPRADIDCSCSTQSTSFLSDALEILVRQFAIEMLLRDGHLLGQLILKRKVRASGPLRHEEAAYPKVPLPKIDRQLLQGRGTHWTGSRVFREWLQELPKCRVHPEPFRSEVLIVLSLKLLFHFPVQPKI